MDKIHDQVRLALNEHHSIRIVFACRTEILEASDLVSSTSTLIKDFLETWRDEANIRHLSVSAYPQHTYSVLDFNNDTYDYNTAHCQISVLPLYLLRRSRRGNWTMFRYKSREKCIAEEIHMLHNFKGWVPLPLLDDHTKGPVVNMTPRWLGSPLRGTEDEAASQSLGDTMGESAEGSAVNEGASDANEI